MRRLYGPAALLVAILSGCTIAPIETKLHVSTTDANRGYALLSFGPARSGYYATHYNIRFAGNGNADAVSILFTNGSLLVKGTPVDFSNREGYGAVYLVELPSGQYYVERFRVYPAEAYSSIADLPFEIKPGEITYLGRFLVVRGSAPDPLVSARRVNAFQEDVEIAGKKFETEVKKNRVNPMMPAMGLGA